MCKTAQVFYKDSCYTNQKLVDGRAFCDNLEIIVFHSPLNHMSRIMRKPDFCICENKGADQLSCNCAADQRLCFCYIDSAIPVLHKSEISSHGCTAWFVSDLVGNTEDRFSYNAAHML